MKLLIKLLPIFFLIVTSCNKENDLPTLPASKALNISFTQAEVEGTITNFTTADLKQCGHCWSTSPNPSVRDSISRIKPVPESMSFSTTILNLEPNTTYYVKSYIVTNDFEIAYGEEISFTTVEDKIIEFHSQDFKNIILNKIDLNRDGEISTSEAIELNGTLNIPSYLDIDNIAEIKYFINITGLRFENYKFTHIDLSHNKKLESIYCYGNELTSLDVSGCDSLKELQCRNNKLTSLKMNEALTKLVCSLNELEELEVSRNLEELDCSNNKLSAINLSNAHALKSLECENNKLTNINLSNCQELERLYCYRNWLLSLDISKNTKLNYLLCYDNKIECIKIYEGQVSNMSSIFKDGTTGYCTE